MYGGLLGDSVMGVLKFALELLTLLDCRRDSKASKVFLLLQVKLIPFTLGMRVKTPSMMAPSFESMISKL
jgi:hypothetical protein